jgi:CHAT domain-containing protein
MGGCGFTYRWDGARCYHCHLGTAGPAGQVARVPERTVCFSQEVPRDRTAGMPESSLAAPAPARPFEHPYFWAGFILIGNPD